MYITSPPLASAPSYDLDSGIDVTFQLSNFIIGESIRIHSGYSISNPPNRSQNAEYGTGTPRFICPEVGFHGAFASVTTRVDNQQLEYISQYPQWASQVYMTSESSDKQQTELLAFTECRGGHNVAIGSNAVVDADGVRDICRHKSFAIKPLCVLTSMPIIDAQNKYITLTLRLNANRAFVYKPNGGADLKIMLDNLYITYETVSEKVALKMLEQMKDLTYPIVSTQMLSIKSNQEYLSLNLPSMGRTVGWIATTVPIYDSTYGNYNQFRTIAIPGLTRLRFTLNGRDVNQTFPMLSIGPGNDFQLELYKAQRVLQLGGLLNKASGMNSSDREFYYKLDGLYADAFDPAGIDFNSASTLGFEINSTVESVTAARQFTMYLTLISRLKM